MPGCRTQDWPGDQSGQERKRSGWKLNLPTRAKPLLLIVAGPNGAGKSTLSSHLVIDLPVIDPDAFGETHPINAGRQVLTRVFGYILARRSFALETTLSGHLAGLLMESATSAGYRVELHFIGLDQVETAILRVQERVARGGHDVPISVQLRRFPRCFENLRKTAPRIERTVLYDNATREGFRELGAIENNLLPMPQDDWPDWAVKLVRTIGR